jgi:hypothetical protein
LISPKTTWICAVSLWIISDLALIYVTGVTLESITVCIHRMEELSVHIVAFALIEHKTMEEVDIVDLISSTFENGVCIGATRSGRPSP